MDFSFFNQLLVIFSVSVVLIALLHRLHLPATLSYLAVGILLGPFNIIDSNMELLAEIGIVFLLFSLGLEFSLAKVFAMQKQVLGLGGCQVLICTALFFLVALAFKVPVPMAWVVAAGLTLSSTAIVSKELTQSNEIKSPYGRQTIAILIFQDIAAVVFLILVSVLGSKGGQSLVITLSQTLLKGGLLVLVMIFAGKYMLPPLFHEIAKVRSQELFVLVAIVIALAAAWLTHKLGLSMALGGFMAGMVLGESHYRHQIESDILPFKDVLLGLFFVSIGLMFDLKMFVAYWPIIISLTLLLILSKAIIISFLSILFGSQKQCAIRTGLTLAQGGEFCFAFLALTSQYDLIDEKLRSIILSVTILSMAIAPLLIRLSERISNYCMPKLTPEFEADVQKLSVSTAHLNQHVLICGFGRVGQSIATFIDKENMPFVALDDDPVRVREAQGAAKPVFYGDSKRLPILQAAGLDRARLVVLSIGKTDMVKVILKGIRSVNQEVPVLVRTRDDSDLDELRELGASEVIPEVLESTLIMISHVLLLLGKPAAYIKQMMDQTRAKRYELLHGYIQGETLKPSEYSLHGVTLTANAYAVDKTANDLKLDQFSVSVHEVKRGEESLAKAQETQLLIQDIVILCGSPANIEAAEKYLLSGTG